MTSGDPLPPIVLSTLRDRVDRIASDLERTVSALERLGRETQSTQQILSVLDEINKRLWTQSVRLHSENELRFGLDAKTNSSTHDPYAEIDRDLSEEVINLRNSLKMLRSELDPPTADVVISDIAWRGEERVYEARVVRELIESPTSYLGDLWTRLHVLRLDADNYIDSCLNLLRAAADWGQFRREKNFLVARALCEQYMSTSSPVPLIPGRYESYLTDSRAMTIRYPLPSIWDLPLLAHEVGHAVMIEQRYGNILDDFPALAGVPAAWRQELLADAYATLVAGPAFGLAASLLEFDPLDALTGTDTHPPGSTRMFVICRILQSARRTPDATLDYLGNSWASLVTSLADQGSENFNGLTEAIADELAGRLKRRIFLPLGTDDASVDEITAQLLSGVPPSNARTSRASSKQLGDTRQMRLVDVMNGAWAARVQSTDSEEWAGIGVRAMELCTNIIERVSSPGPRPLLGRASPESRQHR